MIYFNHAFQLIESLIKMTLDRDFKVLWPSKTKIILLETVYGINFSKTPESDLRATRKLILLKRRSKSKFRPMVKSLHPMPSCKVANSSTWLLESSSTVSRRKFLSTRRKMCLALMVLPKVPTKMQAQISNWQCNFDQWKYHFYLVISDQQFEFNLNFEKVKFCTK